MDETDRALERLKQRQEQPTIPDIHIHMSEEKKQTMPAWLKVAVALGAPALLLELIRRYLP